MSLDITSIQQFITYLSTEELKKVLMISKRYQEIIHTSKYLPYVPRGLLQKLLEDHKGEVTIFMDCRNSFIITQKDVYIRYRQNTSSTLIPPVMPIRHKIVSLNIPVHPKYTIDLTTFPSLKRLTLDIFHEPMVFPEKKLELLRLYFKSSEYVKWAHKLTKLKANKTYVYLHNPSHQTISDIEKHFPNCIVATSKTSDTSVLNRIQCVHNYIFVNNQRIECTSIPVSMAFHTNQLVSSQLVTKAYVYGKLLSPPSQSLNYNELFLFNITLPKRGTISLQNVERLIVGECHNLLGFEGLENCPLKDFMMTKTTSLTSLRFPSTLTYLDASDWKPLALPQLPELQKLRLRDCSTFRFLTIPSKLTSLQLEECSKLKKISNLGEVGVEELKLVELPELTLTEYPTTLTSLTLNNIALFDLDLEQYTTIQHIYIHCCSTLKSLKVNEHLKTVEIHNCNDIEEFSNQHTLDHIFISMCTSINTLELKSKQIKLHYLNQLDDISIDECRSIEMISCKTLPSFESTSFDSWIMKRVTLESEEIPTAKTIIMENVNYPESSIVYYNNDCEVFKVKNMKKIKSLEVPPNVKRLSLFNIGVNAITIPSLVTYLHIRECTLTELIIPHNCERVKLKKCKKLTNLVLPTTLTSIKMKKCPINILSTCYLPYIPFEVLKSLCYPQLD